MTDRKPAKAFLIDMDGTLYDSMRNHTAAWYRMVTGLGISADRDEFYQYEGMTGAATINLIFNRAFGRNATPQEVTELYRRKTVYFNELPPVEPMPGARRFLETLAERGVKRVLVTGSGQASLIDRLEHDFPGAFSCQMMITSRDVSHGKPDPEPYIKAMKLAGTTPDESVVVENAPLGVRAGHDSGAYTVALLTGPIAPEKMRQAGADLVLPSMESLADMVGTLI